MSITPEQAVRAREILHPGTSSYREVDGVVGLYDPRTDAECYCMIRWLVAASYKGNIEHYREVWEELQAALDDVLRTLGYDPGAWSIPHMYWPGEPTERYAMILFICEHRGSIGVSTSWTELSLLSVIASEDIDRLVEYTLDIEGQT